MAEITRLRQGELMRGLLQVLAEHPDGIQAKQALAELSERVPPTEFEQQFYASGGRRYEKIVRFTSIDPARAGWLVKDSGVWTATPEGLQALDELSDPEEFMRRAIQLYRAWKADQADVDESEEPPNEIDEGLDTAIESSATLEEAQESADLQLRAHLQELDPYDFQDLVAGLLEAMGYHVAYRASPGKDGGVDILALRDPLGVEGPRIKVQVKRTKESNRVDVEGLRAFISLLDPQDVGVFVALGGFTSDAIREARAKETKRITLLSFPDLVRLWIEHYDRLASESRRLFPLRPIFYLNVG